MLILFLLYRNIPNKGAGAIARSCLIVLDQCCSKLSNGGFGLKIGQILRKIWRFRPFLVAFDFLKLCGAPLLGSAFNRDITVVLTLLLTYRIIFQMKLHNPVHFEVKNFCMLFYFY